MTNGIFRTPRTFIIPIGRCCSIPGAVIALSLPGPKSHLVSSPDPGDEVLYLGHYRAVKSGIVVCHKRSASLTWMATRVAKQ